MILYLDTSALVKLFVAESGSETVRDLTQSSEALVTASVAYAEARAAFARTRREGGLSGPELRRLVSALDTHWESYAAVDVGMPVARAAGALAEQRGLRGFDAIHLAAALLVRDRTDAELRFCAADGQLASAASAEGLDVVRV
jgi:predicted nucleic acid-binding protein